MAFGLIDTRLTQAKVESNTIQVEGKTIRLGIPKGGPDVTTTIPLKRKGSVQDAAGGVLLMVSPHASYVTGHCLEVTGGVGI